MDYYIIYPSLDSWEWVKNRSIKRGNNKKWLARLKEVFEEYYIALKESNCKKMLLHSPLIKNKEAIIMIITILQKK